uniref:FAD dependent oxidoreductase domain-containing protein n=1 Tax=Chlamydomonas euryale TaxID=1486919 RepID=A0A7R9VNV4_9CHLO|mmetsp:Transcript_39584/g.117770  ORF Transcript_39584/g.117770 Transcript_39584/m.117770 type:complete len:447 (+) Transcript_39584:62-1402(+)
MAARLAACFKSLRSSYNAEGAVSRWVCSQPVRGFMGTATGKGVLEKATSYDVIVLGGCGAYGSAAAYHLAAAGAKVLAIDMHAPGHPWGSSHGGTRIIRLAYFEGPEYVTLVRRSLNMVLDLQADTGKDLFAQTGVLDIGATYQGARAAAAAFGLECEELCGAEINRRFPGYGVPEDMPVLYQKEGGLLCPEAIIQVHCDLAVRHGAVLHRGRVTSWRSLGHGPASGVEVMTNTGESFTAGQLIISAGAWINQLVPQAKMLCVPERQVVAWFQVPDDMFNKESFPVFIAGERLDGPCYYGFPKHGKPCGLKIGCTHQFEPGRQKSAADPDVLGRDLQPEDEMWLRHGLKTFFPAAASSQLLAHSVCMYTNTPDGHFIIDRHPVHQQVLLVSACSGHGFKMSPRVGSLLSDMVQNGARGTDEARDELRPFWLNVERPGHHKFLQAFR